MYLKNLNLPAKRPLSIVAMRGVRNLESILDKKRNIRPSEAMAYKTRGNGNIAPSKLLFNLLMSCLSNKKIKIKYLVDKEQIAPIATK